MNSSPSYATSPSYGSSSYTSVRGGASSTDAAKVWFVVMVFLYIVLNIIGTIYYAKLNALPLSKTITSDTKGGALASVIIGWLGVPIVNITSPILYATRK